MGWGVGVFVVDQPLRVSVTQSGQATTLPVGRLPVGNWGCAEARGVVYMYYLLCRYLVLLVLTPCPGRWGGVPTTVCGRVCFVLGDIYINVYLLG